MERLNKTQAKALFDEYAVLVGDRDVIPEEEASGLFGKAAIDHVHRIPKGSEYYFNGYGIGDYTMFYLTFDGFLRAATYHNIRNLQNKTRKRMTQKIIAYPTA